MTPCFHLHQFTCTCFSHALREYARVHVCVIGSPKVKLYQDPYCVCRLLDWREGRSGPAKSKFDRIVVFKHLFDPSDFDVGLSMPKSLHLLVLVVTMYIQYTMHLKCILTKAMYIMDLTFFLLKDDPTLINEIKDDLRDECSKLGEVKKVLIFDVSLIILSLLVVYMYMYLYHREMRKAWHQLLSRILRQLISAYWQ